MDKSKKTLSQSEIDALVGKFTRASSPPAKAAEESCPVPQAVEENSPPPQVIKKYVPTSEPEPSSEPVGLPSEDVSRSDITASGLKQSLSGGEESLKSLQATVADLSERLSRIEIAIEKFGEMERKIACSNAVQPPVQNVQAMAQQLQGVSSQVQGILGGLQRTLGYDIGKTFSCGSCDSSQFVAIYARCTKCGEEGWWGWWPEEKSP